MSIALLFTLATGLVKAQFPSAPVDVEVITSQINPEVTLSYKQTDICETTPGVRSFAGYVHLPQSVLADMEFDFDIHTFFLFYEARNDAENAPLVIYLAGGPGESSAYVAMSSEGGPCYVNLDGNSTTLNPWSMNNHANMLYIDQPVGAGFSYTSLVNATFDITTNAIVPLTEYDGEIPEDTLVQSQGTLSDPTPWATTNTSEATAGALWHFAEHWLTQFPEYKSNNKNIGIWGNSAGGIWAPNSAALFDQKIKAAPRGSPLRQWSVDHAGVTNGIIDMLEDFAYYPDYFYNNTYASLITEEAYQQAEDSFTKDGGCRDLIVECRAAAEANDSEGTGTNDEVNLPCRTAMATCGQGLMLPVAAANVSGFDIAVSNELTSPYDPCPFYLPVSRYLNQQWTQQSLGVPLNFTYISQAVLDTTSASQNPGAGTGLFIRSTKASAEYLLQNSIKLALVYGDRDARCPWIATEALSLNLTHDGQAAFNAAGYEYISSDGKPQGGAVRQHGNLSFSRVFDAGHAVHAYQPETMDAIFGRLVRGKDIATGERDATDGYATAGPATSWDMYNSTLPDPASTQTCIVAGAFQDESPWLPIFEYAAAAAAGANGTAGGAGEGNSTGEAAGGAEESGSVHVLPWGFVMLSLLLGASGLLGLA